MTAFNNPTNHASLPINDHYDTTALAAEHLGNARAIFKAISAMLDTDTPNVRDALTLAKMAHDTCAHAAADFSDQTAILDEAGLGIADVAQRGGQA